MQRTAVVVAERAGLPGRPLALQHVERPHLARRPDRPVGAVLSVAGGEVRALHPGLEVLLGAPTRDHEADLAIVVGAQQLERLESGSTRDPPGARREAPLELPEALTRNRDRVDLDDAHMHL